ncbi:MAG: DUF11 domain-containing protein, partial [Caldilineae bacterium]
DVYASGTDIYFKLGTVTNADSDTNLEYVVVEFNALVENVAGNQDAADLNNDFQVLINGAVDQTFSTATVTVREPALTVVKDIIAPPSDANDAISYRVVVTNTGSTTAFDTVITDTLPNLVNLDVASLNVTLANGATGETHTAAGNSITVTVTSIPVGGVVTVRYDATASSSVGPGQQIDNTARLIFTSLPGSQGTTGNSTGSDTPGTPGSETGERNGSGGVNDYSAADSAQAVIATPTVDKRTPSPTTYTIGDAVTYDILVTLPEGRVDDLQVEDDLPVGMAYSSYQVITTTTAPGSLLTVDYGGTLPAPTVTAPGGSGDNVIFAFGTVTTTGDLVANNETFQIRLTATVLNVSGNQKDDVLANGVTLRYRNPNTGGTASVSDTPVNITLIEPKIQTTKSVAPTTGVQAGDVLTYTVRFSNVGNSPAYDVTAVDALAQGVAFTSLVSCVDQGGGNVSTTATDGGATVTFDGNPAGSWDIPVGGYIECVYTATAQQSLWVDGNHTNTVDADWSSQDGTSNPQDRVYDDSPGHDMDGSQDTDTASFNVDPLTLSKTDGGVTAATIGDTIPYTLVIQGPKGTVRTLALTDTLPAGLIYAGGQAVSGTGVSPTFSASSPNDGSAPVTLVWDFGNDVAFTGPITVTFQAQVANVMANQRTVNHVNTARLDYTDAAGSVKTLQATDDVTLVEPVLSL